MAKAGKVGKPTRPQFQTVSRSMRGSKKTTPRSMLDGVRPSLFFAVVELSNSCGQIHRLRTKVTRVRILTVDVCCKPNLRLKIGNGAIHGR